MGATLLQYFVEEKRAIIPIEKLFQN